MTLVADPPVARPAPSTPTPVSSPAPAERDPRSPVGRDLLATAAMIVYSGAIAAGFARVFSGWEFLDDLLVLVVGGHLLSFALRRARVPVWVAVPALAVALAWALAALRYRATFSGPFPTRATWQLSDLDLDLVRAQFASAVAPVIYGAGWAVLAGLAIGLVVLLGDTFAFRAHARGESLVPGAVLFVFVAALGTERLRTELTVALVMAGVLAVVALRQLHDRSRRVTHGHPDHTGWRLVPVAIATAVAIGALAATIAPRLPGHGAEPWFDAKGRGGGVTEVISPLVDIRSRLTGRSDNELFRINADRESYWRQTTLAEFDGARFGLPSRSLERVSADQAFSPADDINIRQQIQVLALGGQLIPAAADPFQASGTSAAGDTMALRLNRDTNTLLTSAELGPGDLFTIVSARPDVTADALRAAGSANPPDPMFLGLPDDFADDIRQTAAAVAGDAPTSYDQAIALQSWFRDEFTYSLEVQAGHSIDAIDTFLRIRVGYCEQFAVTFAAMGRALGIPTRVAVGYTPGDLADDGWFTVRGRNAHAWPEVWFAGIGWIAFEPTPGRGAPGAEGYTGVAPAQDTTSGGGGSSGAGSDESIAPLPTTPDTVVPPATRPAGPDGGVVEPDALPIPQDGAVPAPAASANQGSDEWKWLVGLLAVAALGAAPQLIRRLRQAPRGDASDQVLAAWRRAQRAAVRGGVVSAPAMTARTWAAATGDALPMAARPMASLAEVVDLVTFARSDVLDLRHSGISGQTIVDDCRRWADQVVAVADDLLDQRHKLWRYFTAYD